MKKQHLQHHFSYFNTKKNYYRTYDIELESGPGKVKVRKQYYLVIEPFHYIESVILEFLINSEIRVSILKYNENEEKISECIGIMDESDFIQMIDQ